MAVSATLLLNIKNYLDITWDDANADAKLTGIIERGMNYLDGVAGGAQGYEVASNAQGLLFDYCRYVRSNALEVFQINFLHELLSLQISEEVARYEAENPVAIV